MKIVKLVHNPKAGDEEHDKEELIELIESAGFECRYSSTKKEGWKNLEDDIDIIAIAGGDGTVRKVAKLVLGREVMDHSIQLGVLPLGTANNIGKTLYKDFSAKKLIACWQKEKIKKVDIGRISNLKETDFFLEGFGYGIFPYLMLEMKKQEEKYNSPEEEMQGALKKMREIVQTYQPHSCKLEIDGTDHSGKFLLAEVMNIQSIGPNIVLSPLADPGDGEMEVVLVPEAHKEKFAAYIEHRLSGGEEAFHFHTLKGKNINITWEGTHVHVDDELLKIEKEKPVEIQVKEGVLDFLVL
ncbi:MAG TPA: diacylglycerol kinase family protein [Flavisolibacter sp.]|jgi:diacylglycerol kinase family enzyme|nr:diacylglycerol kinase family protein [Flavisolibacter sp.]